MNVKKIGKKRIYEDSKHPVIVLKYAVVRINSKLYNNFKILNTDELIHYFGTTDITTLLEECCITTMIQGRLTINLDEVASNMRENLFDKIRDLYNGEIEMERNCISSERVISVKLK